MPKTITVSIDESKYQIGKMPIGDYPDIIRAIRKLPQHINTFESLKVDDLIKVLPDLASEALPDLLGVLHVATRIELEELSKMGLADIIKLVTAIYEVNNYADVYEVLKKALAHPALQKAKDQALQTLESKTS